MNVLNVFNFVLKKAFLADRGSENFHLKKKVLVSISVQRTSKSKFREKNMNSGRYLLFRLFNNCKYIGYYFLYYELLPFSLNDPLINKKVY